MTRFEVWAPSAGRVELVTRDGRFPMRRGDGVAERSIVERR